MLKGIPPLMSPDLLKYLMEMGHGDELVLADGNFPSESLGRRVVRYDGHGIPLLLETILTMFPLDTYVDQPVVLMDIVPGDQQEVSIWGKYMEILSGFQISQPRICFLDRFSFYERARQAYVIVATSEMVPYANVLLKKGTLKAMGTGVEK